MGRFRRSALSIVAALMVATIGTAAPANAQVLPDDRVAMKVLLVTDGGPSTEAVAGELKSQGVPYRQIDLRDADRPTITSGFLADGSTAHYQAVVMPGPNPFGDPAELAALVAYQQRFDIPQVNAYVWPEAAVGLTPPTYSGPLDGVTGTLTPAAAGAFGYLRGPVPFEDNAPDVAETWGFLALPASPATTPLLTTTAPDGTAGNTLMAEYRAGGRRQLALAFSYNTTQLQFRLLAPGIVTWMTGGVHLGLSRNFLSVQVDDVLMPDARWHVGANCTPGENCPAGVTTTNIRMTSSDALATAAWQARQDFRLDLVFNANGSVDAAAESRTGRDQLTDMLIQLRSFFRWTNHTWSHQYLGCVRDTSVVPWRCETDSAGRTVWVSRATLTSEIADNVAWATAKKLPIDPSELVTGEHSGLMIQPQQPQANPYLAPVLTAHAIGWIAADNSRMPQQTRVGSALTVPRYPMNVFFNVAKRTEQVDEYNWIYTARADGGSGICEDNPLTVTCIPPLDPATGFTDYIVPLETRFALARMLANDPRPHFVHQSNLAEDRILLPLLDNVLNRYRSLLTDDTPIVNPRLSAAGTELRRQQAWRDAVAAGQVTGYIQGKQVHVTAPATVDIPLTSVTGTMRGTAKFGEAYAGKRSAWVDAAVVDVVLP